MCARSLLPVTMIFIKKWERERDTGGRWAREKCKTEDNMRTKKAARETDGESEKGERKTSVWETKGRQTDMEAERGRIKVRDRKMKEKQWEGNKETQRNKQKVKGGRQNEPEDDEVNTADKTENQTVTQIERQTEVKTDESEQRRFAISPCLHHSSSSSSSSSSLPPSILSSSPVWCCSNTSGLQPHIHHPTH